MQVYVKLGPPFGKILGHEKIIVDLSRQEAFVKEIIAKIYEDNPGFYKRLKQEGYLKNDMPKAIVVVDGKLADCSALVSDQSNIKILTPMCGG